MQTHTEQRVDSQGSVETVPLTEERATAVGPSGFKVNKCYVWTFMALIWFQGLALGFAIPSANNLNSMLDVMYNWDTASKERLGEQSVAAIIVAGQGIGCGFGGKVIQYGRRQAIMISSFTALAATGIFMIENYYFLLLGRFIYGCSVGVGATAVARCIGEILPSQYQNLGISWYLLSQFFSCFLCLISGVIVPEKGSPEEATSDVWRIIFGQPFVWNAAILVLQFTVLTNESPKFLAANGD